MRRILLIFAAYFAEIMFIHQYQNWTNFSWESEKLLSLLAEVRHIQGKVLGKMEAWGFDLQDEAVLETLSLEIAKSSEIEDEYLVWEQVRSSMARRLGMDWAATTESDRQVEGFVEIMVDATQKCEELLTLERLFAWHCALFPTGRNKMHKIKVGQWRDDAKGAMQVVSGRVGKEIVHFQAIEAVRIETEIAQFLAWFNCKDDLDTLLKAAIAHFWFVTIHPFEDGNGRIARVLTEMLLARSDKTSQRFYSLSAQIRVERKQYYAMLESTQKGKGDLTAWLLWFLNVLKTTLLATDILLAKVLAKATFWHKYAQTTLNDRQKLLINRLFDGFEGKLTSAKWAKIAKCSTDTALRDIQDLMDKGILQKTVEGGRSTNYVLNV